MKKFIKRIFGKPVLEEFTNGEIEFTEIWMKYNNGNSVGKKGSEGGKILDDQEHINGARITIEANVEDIPFAVTLGIYGLMFHTEFFSEKEVATEYFERKKNEIDRILEMLEIPQDNQDIEWENKKEEYLEKLISI
ncbi:hypothetical protein [Flavobacterium anhuiense]|uniref:hypothetical protein n=1 Tax=Flavobacterium anhuiense TaxID=459526 RepID=UPI003D983BCC